MEDRQYVTVKEVSNMLGVTPFHVRSFVKRGIFSSIDITLGQRGKPAIRIKRSDVEAFIRKGGSRHEPKVSIQQ